MKKKGSKGEAKSVPRDSRNFGDTEKKQAHWVKLRTREKVEF